MVRQSSFDPWYHTYLTISIPHMLLARKSYSYASCTHHLTPKVCDLKHYDTIVLHIRHSSLISAHLLFDAGSTLVPSYSLLRAEVIFHSDPIKWKNL